MVLKYIRLFAVLLSLFHLAPTCKGTETGNPPQPGGSPKIYSNTDEGVTASYDEGWTFSEGVEPSRQASPGAPEDGAGNVAPAEGINIDGAPFTEFTDGMTTVTLYFVAVQATNLESYLGSVFPSRTFQPFSNPQVSGFKYDNPEAGAGGSDKQEYYFRNGTTLLYIVAELFQANDGADNFQTLINSIRFD